MPPCLGIGRLHPSPLPRGEGTVGNHRMRIGITLFTVRDFVKTRDDLRQSLELIHAIGYEGIQLSAVACMEGENPEVDAAAMKRLAEEYGHEIVATHRPLVRLEEDSEREIAFHLALGCRYVAIPVPPAGTNEEGLDGYERLADRMNEVAAKFRPHGLRLGYHNHAFEFQRFGPEGEWPFAVMMDRTEPDVFSLLDTYWVVHAGVDLLALIERLNGRLPVVHLKDRAMYGNEADFAPVGEGNMSWNTILPALEAAGMEWGIVEQDTCRRDVWDCVAGSWQYLSSVS